MYVHRQVSGSEVGAGWGEEDPELRIAALAAHLAQHSRLHQPAHVKVTCVWMKVYCWLMPLTSAIAAVLDSSPYTLP